MGSYCFFLDRYLAGGVESGFKKVERDKYEARLLQVKGRRNVRVQQVCGNTPIAWEMGKRPAGIWGWTHSQCMTKWVLDLCPASRDPFSMYVELDMGVGSIRL